MYSSFATRSVILLMWTITSEVTMTEYKVEYMGKDGTDMYETEVRADDIESAYAIALLKKDKETDRVIGIYELF